MEEKILALLGQILDEQKSTNARIDKLESRMSSLETKVDSLEVSLNARIDVLEQNLEKTTREAAVELATSVEVLSRELTGMKSVVQQNLYDVTLLKNKTA